MKFRIKGQKENLLVLAKEGRGVEFKGIIQINVKEAFFQEQFTCSYDRYRSLYTGDGCCECMDLGLCASSNHYIYHRNR